MKRCRICQSQALVLLSSFNLKLCADCGHYNEWHLKPNQPSVLIEGKVGYDRLLDKQEKPTTDRH